MDVTNPNENNPKLKRSLGELISDLPGLARDLIKAEIEVYKAQAIAKGKSIAFAAALFLVAAIILFWVVAVLIASAVLAFSLVLPGWAAALVVAAILLLIIVIIVIIGVARLKSGTSGFDEPVKDAIAHDVDAVKGVGEYDV